MKKIVMLFILLALLATPLAGVAAQEAASVFVVHGIPGAALGLDPALPVDVAVDGACVLEGFTFGEIAGPLSLPPGTYMIEISLAADPPCSAEPVIAAEVPFTAGENATVIAHLSSDGQPTASKFVNDFSAVDELNARLIAHHTAAAPTVDVMLAYGPPVLGEKRPTLLIEDFSPGAQVAAEVMPGPWWVSIMPADSDQVVFGPVKLAVKPLTAYLIYAVGSLETNTFTLLVYDVARLGSTDLPDLPDDIPLPPPGEWPPLPEPPVTPPSPPDLPDIPEPPELPELPELPYLPPLPPLPVP